MKRTCRHLARPGIATMLVAGGLTLLLAAGSPTIAQSPPPTIAPPGSLRDVRVASTGTRTLVLRPDGIVVGHGDNRYNMLGRSPAVAAVNRLRPVQGVPAARDVAAAGFFSLVLGADGRVYAWGWQDDGVLGGDAAGPQGRREQPEPLPGLNEVQAIAACARAAAALRRDGSVWMWGHDGDGLLGQQPGRAPAASGAQVVAPIRVPGLDDVRQIACGSRHMLALRRDGTVFAWGWNRHGQLGTGDLESRGAPVTVPGLSGVVEVMAAEDMSAARLADGRWRAWGLSPLLLPAAREWKPQPTSQPALLPPPLDRAAMLAGHVALLPDGRVMSWGTNEWGQLGTGSADTDLFAARGVPVGALPAGIAGVWSGGTRGIALAGDGTLWIWGAGVRRNERLPVAVGNVNDPLAP